MTKLCFHRHHKFLADGCDDDGTKCVGSVKGYLREVLHHFWRLDIFSFQNNFTSKSSHRGVEIRGGILTDYSTFSEISVVGSPNEESWIPEKNHGD